VKNAISRIALLAAIVIACWWSWQILFPSSEQVIRKRLSSLAQTASASNAPKLAAFFTTDAQIDIDVSSHHLNITGRDEMMAAAAMAARSQPGRYKVEFGSQEIEVASDNTSAIVHLTAKVTVSGESDWIPQELKITFQKIDGNWLISRLETVKTLL
jgi:ketosteroid isomerase-like protein